MGDMAQVGQAPRCRFTSHEGRESGPMNLRHAKAGMADGRILAVYMVKGCMSVPATNAAKSSMPVAVGG